LPLEVFRQWNFVVDFNSFCQNFCEKLQIWVSEPHFGEVRGDARPRLMARWKAHGRLSIRVNWLNIFAIYYGSRVMRRLQNTSVKFVYQVHWVNTKFTGAGMIFLLPWAWRLPNELDIWTWSNYSDKNAVSVGQCFQ